MPVQKKGKAKPAAAFARLTPFVRGGIYYLSQAGMSLQEIEALSERERERQREREGRRGGRGREGKREGGKPNNSLQEIADAVTKPDGTHPCKQTVAETIAQAKRRGGDAWDGGMGTDAGRPRVTTKALDKAVAKVVFKYRGSAVVTVKFVRKVLPEARAFSCRTIERRLADAGLAWLRRRRKAIVPSVHFAPRLRWAAWVLRRTSATLSRWAYTDGTVFYLAKCDTQREDKIRASLGPMMWRMADGSDALFEECIGPSAYWKAQGRPVRVWGLLVAGKMFITVLPEGQVMNGTVYANVINKRFGGWLRDGLGRRQLRSGVFLLQDHERALWRAGPREAMRAAGITLLENFPKCSQDLNPMEICWRELRARLDETCPTGPEARQNFVARLRAATAWVNVHRADYLKTIASSQKEWARDVQQAKPPGSRTKH